VPSGTENTEGENVTTIREGEGWGEGLAYPEWVAQYLPAMHSGFNAVNKYVSVPALRAGLGRLVSNPLTGYLMILRTRGRKSGEMRDAPLGYGAQLRAARPTPFVPLPAGSASPNRRSDPRWRRVLRLPEPGGAVRAKGGR
jgi:hypothetical protein